MDAIAGAILDASDHEDPECQTISNYAWDAYANSEIYYYQYDDFAYGWTGYDGSIDVNDTRDSNDQQSGDPYIGYTVIHEAYHAYQYDLSGGTTFGSELTAEYYAQTCLN